MSQFLVVSERVQITACGNHTFALLSTLSTRDLPIDRIHIDAYGHVTGVSRLNLGDQPLLYCEPGRYVSSKTLRLTRWGHLWPLGMPLIVGVCNVAAFLMSVAVVVELKK